MCHQESHTGARCQPNPSIPRSPTSAKLMGSSARNIIIDAYKNAHCQCNIDRSLNEAITRSGSIFGSALSLTGRSPGSALLGTTCPPWYVRQHSVYTLFHPSLFPLQSTCQHNGRIGASLDVCLCVPCHSFSFLHPRHYDPISPKPRLTHPFARFCSARASVQASRSSLPS